MMNRVLVIVMALVTVACIIVVWTVISTRPDALPIVFGGLVAGIVAVLLMLVIRMVLRRLDPIWARGGTISVDDHGVLTVYTKKLFREVVREAEVKLDDVAMITWYIDMFDPSGAEFIQFWDEDPELTMDILGLMPRNRAAKTLVEIPRRFLGSAPTAEARLRFELERRIEQGTLLANVDVQTWEAVGSELPPLAVGIRFEGRKVIREQRRRGDA